MFGDNSAAAPFAAARLRRQWQGGEYDENQTGESKQREFHFKLQFVGMRCRTSLFTQRTGRRIPAHIFQKIYGAVIQAGLLGEPLNSSISTPRRRNSVIMRSPGMIDSWQRAPGATTSPDASIAAMIAAG